MNVRLRTILGLLSVLLLIALPPASSARKKGKGDAPAAAESGKDQGKGKEGTGKEGTAKGAGDCRSCHAKIYKGKVKHGPVEVGQCTACHPAKGPVPKGKHPAKFFSTTLTDAPCLSCHKDVAKSLKSGVVHAPLKKEGGCRKCHKVHAADTKGLLTARSAGEQCAQCHKGWAKKLQFKYMHGPVAVGACNVCHSPHAGKDKLLLVATGPQLCYSCHDAEQFQKAKVKHKALEKGCTSCHSPHGSAQKYFVKSEPLKLCGSCHEKVVKLAKNAKVKHKAIEQAGCGACHEPHGSRHDKLMRADGLKVCTNCHPAPVKGEHKHSPVEEGSCADCHKPHGGDHVRMLVRAFPAEFYGRFSRDRFALCFECHEEAIVRDKYTTSLTGFRDGKRNLHFLHAVEPGVGRKDKGRSCKACHEVHAGSQSKQIRESVPFGKAGWLLPVTFTERKDGGTCVVGCHRPQTYSRNKP